MKINKDSYFKKITGYKISNSHFELGSNLHITDYYYAKRLFYNSFYTNRFAFLITRFIISEFSHLINAINALPDPQIKDRTITLLGFENYSELLVSNIRKMLTDYIKHYQPGQACFNHEIYTKESLFLKNPDNIGKNIISIFPISTTFSTSVKIQNEVREILGTSVFKNKGIVFHNPVINCLIITDKEFMQSGQLPDGAIEREFGWERIIQSKRTIEMRNLDLPSEMITQYYFVNLSTLWQKINECNACYPDVKTEEKCLFETKDDPVTPSLIFSYPKAMVRESSENVYTLFKPDSSREPIIYRKHFKKNKNNFIYYIRTGIFLKKNRNLIENWLRENKSQLKHLNDKNIVIVTPSTGSNSGFVNIVNDLLFSETATIIQYNPSEDYLYNFKTFYSGVLEQADYIIFVDDILFTTNTFSEINFYVKNIHRKKEIKGIDFCMTLINRSGYYNNTKLEDQLRGHENFSIVSFVNINVAPILHRQTFPYVKLTKKFAELSSKSVLDEMRIHFKNKESDFAEIDLTRRYQKINGIGGPKDLFQFIVLNEFNKLFQFNPKSNSYQNELFINNVFEGTDKNTAHHIITEVSNSQAVKDFIIDYSEYKFEIKNCLYKICSSEPFIQFKNVRQLAFHWVLTDLKRMVEQILAIDTIAEDFFVAKNEGRPVKYSKYQEFKFLLKRGTKLKINYIYSIDVLTALEKVLQGIKTHKYIQYYTLTPDPGNPNTLFDDKMEAISSLIVVKGNPRPIFVHGFITYYIGLLQELIIDHESKALQTVINVKEIIDKQIEHLSTNLKNNYDSGYINLLRMLVLENTFIFSSSSEKFLRKCKIKVTLKDLIEGNNNVERFKDNLKTYSSNYSFGYTKKMLSRIEKGPDNTIIYKEDPPMFESFVNMLVLKSALTNDRLDNGQTSSTVKQKIEIILKYCSTILNIENGGALFAVKYKNKNTEETLDDDVAIVGEYYNHPNNYLKTSDINSKSVLYHVFNGIRERNNTKSLSSFELSRTEQNEYVFIENESLSRDNIQSLYETENNKFRNYYYLRISTIKSLKNKTFAALPIAVLCFYDNIPVPLTSKYVRFDPKRIRQLLLLRNDISNFINNQLNNDSLRAYIEQQNQTIINKAITHSFDTYVKQYTRTLDEIENQNLRDKFEILGTLILNKHMLLKFIADYLKDNNLKRSLEELRLYTKDISAYDFIDFVKRYSSIIFSMYLNTHSKIDPTNVSIQFEIIESTTIRFYEFFYRELIFEIFYNIRKNYNTFVDDNRKLEIIITIKTGDDGDYLSFKNNLYNLLSKNKKTKIQLDNSMYNRKEKKGISLINTISYILYDRKCQLIIKENEFEILIPIEKHE